MKKYSTLPSLTTGFSAKGKSAKKRFVNILDTRIKRGGLIAVLGTLLLAFAIGGCFAGAGLGSETALATEEINIAVIGLDSEERNDAVLVCELSDQSLKITQLPRNTWVKNATVGHQLDHMDLPTVPFDAGDEEGRFYDPENILAGIYESTGIRCDRYAAVDYQGLRDIIDCMGGIDFDVPIDMEYDDKYQDLHIDLKAGMQHLDGQGVEQVMRYRRGNPDSNGVITGYENGDLGRLDTHRKLYETVREKLRTDGVSAKLIKTVADNVVANLTYEDMAVIAERVAKLDADRIEIGVIDGEQVTDETGAYYLTVVSAEKEDPFTAYDTESFSGELIYAEINGKVYDFTKLDNGLCIYNKRLDFLRIISIADEGKDYRVIIEGNAEKVSEDVSHTFYYSVGVPQFECIDPVYESGNIEVKISGEYAADGIVDITSTDGRYKFKVKLNEDKE